MVKRHFTDTIPGFGAQNSLTRIFISEDSSDRCLDSLTCIGMWEEFCAPNPGIVSVKCRY